MIFILRRRRTVLLFFCWFNIDDSYFIRYQNKKILVNISLKVIDLSKNITNFNKEFYKYFKNR